MHGRFTGSPVCLHRIPGESFLCLPSMVFWIARTSGKMGQASRTKKTKMEISLYRLEMCAKQAKLGVSFKPNTPSATTCEDIVYNIPPNQVIPHSHKLK